MDKPSKNWSAILTFCEPSGSDKSSSRFQYTLSPGKTTAIGRSPECEVVLDAQKYVTVSRRHAEIKFVIDEKRGNWQVCDTGTTNGTLVNNQQIKGCQNLKSGDHITLGWQGPEFLFEYTDLSSTFVLDEDQLDNISNTSNAPTEYRNLKELNTSTSAKSTLPPLRQEELLLTQPPDSVYPETNLPSELKSSPDQITSTPLASSGRSLWNLITNNNLADLIGHIGLINALAFSSDGHTLASGGDDQIIKLWNLTTQTEAGIIKAYQMSFTALAFSANLQTLASGGADGTIKLWNLATKEEIGTLQGHLEAVNTLTFTTDGQILISGSSDTTIRFWDVKTGEEKENLKAHKQPITALACSLNGQMLASAAKDKTIRLWNLTKLRPLITLANTHSLAIKALAFSPNGQLLVSAAEDQLIKLWRLDTHELICNIAIPFQLTGTLAFSPDGEIIAQTIENEGIKLWQI